MKKIFMCLTLIVSCCLLTKEEPKEGWLEYIREKSAKAWTTIEQKIEKGLQEVKGHVDNLFERHKDVAKQASNIKKRTAVLEEVKRELNTPQAKAHPDHAVAQKAVDRAIKKHQEAEATVEKIDKDLKRDVQQLKDKVVKAADNVKKAHDDSAQAGKSALEDAHRVLKDVKLGNVPLEAKVAPQPMHVDVTPVRGPVVVAERK